MIKTNVEEDSGDKLALNDEMMKSIMITSTRKILNLLRRKMILLAAALRAKTGSTHTSMFERWF